MARAKKQTEMAGMETPSIEEIEGPAEDMRAYYAEIQALKEKMGVSKKLLIAAMKERDLETHRYEDNDGNTRRVVLTSSNSVAIKKIKPPADAGGGAPANADESGGN